MGKTLLRVYASSAIVSGVLIAGATWALVFSPLRQASAGLEFRLVATFGPIVIFVPAAITLRMLRLFLARATADSPWRLRVSALALLPYAVWSSVPLVRETVLEYVPASTYDMRPFTPSGTIGYIVVSAICIGVALVLARGLAMQRSHGKTRFRIAFAVIVLVFGSSFWWGSIFAGGVAL